MIVPLLVAAIFGLSPRYFAVFIAFLSACAAFEWAGLSGCSPRSKYIYATSVLLLVICAHLIDGVTGPILIAGGLWWLCAPVMLIRYDQSGRFIESTVVRLVIGLLVLFPTATAILFVRSLPQGAWLVLYLVLVVSAADIGAYFAGKAFGRHKLAPRISPGKTVEGLVGGGLFSLIVAGIFASLTLDIQAGLSLVTITALLAFISVLGDLVESIMKRIQNVEDSGTLLPGHGGILDRIDSLTVSAPLFALAQLLGISFV